ncbi:MAG: tandem-95 repeat protein [Chloroflexi bacterium]|nr:tandem-95 repeat protein [Chloroflexota bacterium]
MKMLLLFFKPIFAVWLAVGPLVNPIGYNPQPAACPLCLKTDNAPLFAVPIAQPDAYTAGENTQLVVNAASGVLFNDNDADSDPLSAVLDTDVTNGVLNLAPDGSFTYDPDTDFTGSDSFTYHASGGGENSAETTVTLTVSATPSTADDTYTVLENVTLNQSAPGVLSNDTDPESDPLTATLVDDVTQGTLSLNEDGSFSYTPPANTHGSTTFTYTATDSFSTSDSALVTLNINGAPDTTADSYETGEDEELIVSSPGVLSNDTDPETESLTAVLDQNVQHGTLNLSSNGSFTYTPTSGYSGSDQFSYYANDGHQNSPSTTVTITVTAANDAPVAVDDAHSTTEDTLLTVTAPGVLTNDTDLDGDTLSAILVDDAAHGTLALSSNGSFTYDPDDNFTGSDSFTYTANDGTANSTPATVTITVTAANDAPVAVNDVHTTAEDTTLTVLVANSILNNDTDPDGDDLTAVLVDDAAHGTLTLNANGSFTYDPDDNFTGSDTFTYKANDSALDSNTATVTITVTAANDAPVAVDDAHSTTEDTLLTVLVANSILNNDTDVDGDSLTAILVDNAAHGTLTLNANGSFTYDPDDNFTGSDTFTYTANDSALDSNTATVTITVTAANDAPVAVNNAHSTAEDTLLTVAAPGVLTNDTDVDGDPLTAILVSDVSDGTLALNADGSFTYDPDDNFTGSDSFTYKANDGTADSAPATVTITITAVNDAPVAVNDSFSTAEDSALIVTEPGVLQNDSDIDLNPLTVVLDTTTHGTLALDTDGSFIYMPASDYNGTDTFTYHLNDGTTNSAIATVTITITPVNDAPKAYNEAFSTLEDTILEVAAPGILTNDTDVDENPLTAVLGTTTAHGTLTLNPDGSFTYQPNLNYTGTDSFMYTVSDGSASSTTATATITISPVNDAPVGVAEVHTVLEDNTLTVADPGILGNDTDVEGNTLSAVLNQTVNHGTLTLNTNGSFTYTPTEDYNGSDSFSYRAYDGSLYSAITTVSLTITAVNDSPVAGADSYIASLGSVLNVDAPGVLDNDTDVENDELSARLLTPPEKGVLIFNSDGSFSYTTDPYSSYTATFTYEAYDGNLASTSTTVTIQVIPGAVIDVSWTEPTTNTQYYFAEDEFIQLEVEITNCTSGCSARFVRWDPEANIFVDIHIDDTAPYQATIHSKNILPGWNEFDVVAFDGEGHASQRRYIWIWRDYWNYMPMPTQ